MTLSPGWFLNATGQFTPLFGGTSTTTGLMTTITKATTQDILFGSAGFTDGPSVSQGSSGVWLVMGTVTLQSSTNASSIGAKLWDGTTVLSESNMNAAATNFAVSISLSGVITNPAGNLRISAKNFTNNTGAMTFNAVGDSVGCTITAIRIG